MTHEQTPEETLRHDAITLTKQVANLDAEIAKLQESRQAVMKELRAAKAKLLTIDLNRAAA